MSRFNNLTVQRDDRDVVTVTFDVPGRPVNLFDESLLGELSLVVDDLQRDGTSRLVLFRSAKPSGFFAGADVSRIHDITTAERAEAVLLVGQRLFQHVEQLPMPTVAALHGHCLGGGLEFAMACDHRLAQDDGSTRLGLPETQLGLIPGWGGTQRLPQLVGLATATQMILTARQVTAAKALKIGLVDEIASPQRFDNLIATFIDDRLSGQPLRHPRSNWLHWLRDDTAPGRALVLMGARSEIAERATAYPALPAALRAIEVGIKQGMDAGLAAEREEFSRVLFDPACRNLMELFFQRERARSRSTWVGAETEPTPTIETIAVVGAGTMGAGIAQLAATRGFQVVLKDVDEPALQRGMERIEATTDNGVRKGALTKADARRALAAITTTTESGPLAQAGLIIEAVVERLDIKRDVFGELDALLPDHALLASNTSALSISEMASVTQRADRVAGLHFFNPVHKMPLVEVVRTPATSGSTIAGLVDVVRRLGKTPLVVAEGPGFLVNRILFPYLDEAVRLLIEGRAADEIDREARSFGMPMGPLELLDTVGIDVAADVSQTLITCDFEESPTPGRLRQMVSIGTLGVKTGSGFYNYDQQGNGRTKVVNDDSATAVDSVLPPECELNGEVLSGIQRRLVFSLINAAAESLREGIVPEAWMVDLGMVLGTGFPPFRGGPLHLVETWGNETVIAQLHQLADLCGPRFRPSEQFTEPRSIVDAIQSAGTVGV